MSPRYSSTLLVAASCIALSAPVACSSGSSSHPGRVGGTGGSGGRAAGGRDAGSGGTAGSAGTGAAGTAGQSTGGTAGGGGTAGIGTGTAGNDAGGGAGGTPPVDSACSSPVAFWATGASFTYPTPPKLASALSGLTYDYGTHPLTVVLLPKGGSARLAVSATETQSGGFKQVFPSAMAPTPVDAVLSAGGFHNSAEQSKGWLRVTDLSGSRDIEIDSINLSATTASSCNSIVATLTATIPSSQSSVQLDLAGGSTTLGALAQTSGGPDGGVQGWNLKMLFTGESTDFDFASL